LKDAHIDGEERVIGVRTGSQAEASCFGALDTVFFEGTDVKVKEKDGILCALGIAAMTRVGLRRFSPF
jgi:hypothetical protein